MIGRLKSARTVLSGEVRRTTVKAVLFFNEEDDDEFWIPRSVITDGEDVVVDDTEIEVENWWLRENGHG